MFPIYTADQPCPDEGIYYILAKNGNFMRVVRKFGSAIVPVDDIIDTEISNSDIQSEIEPDLKLNIPQVSSKIIAQAHHFFRMVWDEFQSEAYVHLYFSHMLNKYRLYCPLQYVSSASVYYDRTDGISKQITKSQGWTLIGTIHSHCDFSAFHSGTDVHDEDSFDGLHITIGHVNQVAFSICASISVNKYRWQMDPVDCIANIILDTDDVDDQKRFYKLDSSLYAFEEQSNHWLKDKVRRERLPIHLHRSL